jgi:hypothetical protein
VYLGLRDFSTRVIFGSSSGVEGESISMSGGVSLLHYESLCGWRTGGWSLPSVMSD